MARPLLDQFAGDDPVTQRHAHQEVVDPGPGLAIEPPFQLRARNGRGGRLRRRERVVEPEEASRLPGFSRLDRGRIEQILIKRPPRVRCGSDRRPRVGLLPGKLEAVHEPWPVESPHALGKGYRTNLERM